MKTSATVSSSQGLARLLVRASVAIILGAAAASLPVGQASACSCMPFSGPEELVAAHDLTLIGTVVDTAEGGLGDFGGRTMRYALQVERASASTDPVLVVISDNSTTCGLILGMGERWLVAAHRDGLELETGLCSGSQPADGIDAADLAAYGDLVDSTPVRPAEPTGSVPWPAVVVALAVLGLGAATAFAFRQSRRPS